MAVLRPGPAVAAGLAAINLLIFWLKLPVVGNHEIILALVSLAVFVSVLTSRRSWFERCAPAGRWILVVSYGFIALSKFNTGFLDLKTSCALLFADGLGGAFGLDPRAIPGAKVGVIMGTVVIESAIPLLLLRPRLRTYGVALALCFHFVLALDPVAHVWDFSATLFPLFLLFLPPSFLAQVARHGHRLARRSQAERGLAVALILVAQGFVASGATPFPLWAVAYPLWLVAGSGLLAALAWYLVVSPSSGPGGSSSAISPLPSDLLPAVLRLRWRLARPLMPVVAIAMLVGVGPYLGLRSAAAFNMYSNLRIHDGTSNHLLIGALPAPVSDRSAPSTVEIVDAETGSALRYYIDLQLLVPTENLARYLRENQHEDPLVRFDGALKTARQAGLDGDRPAGWPRAVAAHLRHKLAYRRAVDGTPEARCLRAWGPLG